MYTRVKWSLLTDESVLEAYLLLLAYERLLDVLDVWPISCYQQ
jgi:hypothetical protein